MIYLLSQLIDQSSELFPERHAFRYYDKSLTYADLSHKTHQLANILKAQGIERGDRVGIFMNKCLQMPLAVHGILKAGAAYVPIDPAAPAHRIKYIIQHCGIRALITQQSKSKVVADIVEATQLECLIGIGGEYLPGIRSISWEEVHQAPASGPDIAPLTEMDLAYIMYTSGSTGDPKGIMHTHHSGLSYAKISADVYQLNENDIMGNHSPLHFDMSTFEFFSGPLKGACTVLVPEEYTKLPASLSQLMSDEQMTVWYSVPFALIQLLLRGALEKRDLGSLRWIVFGGEPFPTKYLRALMQRLPNARFSNSYGPAEVNQCTYYHVPHAPEDTDPPAPIGQMWDNSMGLVVDSHDQPVANGEKGELLVRAPTMMQGYWDNEALNRRAFFVREPYPGYSEIFYRTGDLVKMGKDGNYIYVGRKDRQIKSRGYRVELDEIEAAMMAHDHVEEAAAFAVPDREGSLLIHASVTLKDGTRLSPVELTHHLKERLSWYAVPQNIDVVKAFKRTATGKIDRKALKEAALRSTF